MATIKTSSGRKKAPKRSAPKQKVRIIYREKECDKEHGGTGIIQFTNFFWPKHETDKWFKIPLTVGDPIFIKDSENQKFVESGFVISEIREGQPFGSNGAPYTMKGSSIYKNGERYFTEAKVEW